MLPVTMGNCLRYQIAEDDEGVQAEEIWKTRPKPDAVHWVLEASQLQLRANGKVAAMGEGEEEEREEEEEEEEAEEGKMFQSEV